MFDKLIESEPAGADFRNRRRYFITSSVIVGILFVTAVVASIYAADIGLGNSSFELAELLQPVEMAAVEPEPIRPQPPASSPSRSELPTRQANIMRIDEMPTTVPQTISTTRNTQMARPDTQRFIPAGFDSDPAGDPGGNSRQSTASGPAATGLSTNYDVPDVSKDSVPPPPLIKKPVEKHPPILKSDGVINGKATYLPIPAYPAPAKAIGASGKVDVQVIIDESGKVISANAVSGNPLLRAAAEKAAWGAKFSTTFLSKVPVKVTGVIVYNFTR